MEGVFGDGREAAVCSSPANRRGHRLQQQSKFDAFREEFNNERPHQALEMKCPAEIYTPSPRPYSGLPELAYPFHDTTIQVTRCGRICLHRKKINLSTVFAGQAVGLKAVDEGIWWLVLWIMIWATLIWRKGPYNLWTTHLVQK